MKHINPLKTDLTPALKSKKATGIKISGIGLIIAIIGFILVAIFHSTLPYLLLSIGICFGVTGLLIHFGLMFHGN